MPPAAPPSSSSKPPPPPPRARWASAGVRHRDGQSRVTRLDLAIYCYTLAREGLAGTLELESVRRISPGRHEVVFKDPHGVVSEMELELANGRGHGEAAKWSRAVLNAQRDLKAIMRLADEPLQGVRQRCED